MHAFKIDIGGQAYQGLWRTCGYDRLTVESDYGSTYAYLDGRDPEALACSLLTQLIARSEQAVG